MTAVPNFRVLLPRDEILRRCHELARQIAHSFRDEPPMLVAVVEGARTFARHLQAALPGTPPVHEIRASSYGHGTTSSGTVHIVGAAAPPCAGRHVLLIEDIVDTGRTVEALTRHVLGAGAASCTVATLLSKPSRRVVPCVVHHVGFEIPDEFVIGFGMDFANRYRDLPEVVVYDAGVEAAATASTAL